jgi:molybdate transport system ATP-binding protein
VTGIDARFAGCLGRFAFDIAFTAPGRGITALFGPSGCGKTTVLRCLAGLTRIAGGYLRVDGEVWQDSRRFVPPHRRAVGYVFQEASLFPHLSVRGNLMYGRRRAAAHEDGTGFDNVVALLGLAPLLDRGVAALSGGERQRVALGRALLSRPRLLLMDEPLAALDHSAKNEIIPYFERLHERLSIPAIYVSHDLVEVEQLADHLVLLEAGRVRAAGPVDTLAADLDLPLASAADAGVTWSAQVVGDDRRYDLTTLVVPGGRVMVPGRLGTIGARRRLRVAATDVSIARTPPQGSSILNVLPARVVAVSGFTPSQLTVLLRLAGGDDNGVHLFARVTRRSWDALALAVGTEVYAQIKAIALAERSPSPADLNARSSAPYRSDG